MGGEVHFREAQRGYSPLGNINAGLDVVCSAARDEAIVDNTAFSQLVLNVRDSLFRPSPETRSSIEHGDRRNPYPEDSQEHLTDIMNVLRRRTESRSGDPRDRIYGILGMTRTVVRTRESSDVVSPGQGIFILDYNKSRLQFFKTWRDIS